MKNMFKPTEREQIVDSFVSSDLEDEHLNNKLFVRLVAKGKKFNNINFMYSIFDSCYLRNCVFDSCDFTGCRFVGANFHGSSFIGCKFDYAIFERTSIDEDILRTGCPGYENLKLKFARSLRTNFQQLGNSIAVNKAIQIELEATEIHLKKSWNSNEAYYTKKYKGRERLIAFLKWLNFKTLDFIWGNGESAWKLTRTVIFTVIIISLYDVFKTKNIAIVVSYWEALIKAPEIFLGITYPEQYSSFVLVLIASVKLILIGFFLSIIIKKFNRR